MLLKYFRLGKLFLSKSYKNKYIITFTTFHLNCEIYRKDYNEKNIYINILS